MTSQAQWVAVDWGTSNLRAWGIDALGDVVFARASDQGMGKLVPEAYPGVLGALLDGTLAANGEPVDVLICGMAGARQGWMEAPYLDAPADLGMLHASAVTPSAAGTRFSPRILPGVCQRAAGAEDVMRGEEIQLLGLGALLPGFSGVVCMPGTHCKWVQLVGRRVERLATVMTGELFEVLRTHSLLRHSLAGPTDGPGRAKGLQAGLDAGIGQPEKLPALLFKVRSGALLSQRAPDWCAGFLSGLLIGAEVGAQRDWLASGEAAIVGDAALAGLYATALGMIGAKVRVIDGTEAVVAGLKAARRQG